MSRVPNDFIATYQQRVNNALTTHLNTLNTSCAAMFNSTELNNTDLARLCDAMAYCLLGGGKRIRPLLIYASAFAINRANSTDEQLIQQLDAVACAVEMIHAYSLIHDDLPAMDNAALRHGQASCHLAFDEATAILVGDALQAQAFTCLSEIKACSASRLSLIQHLARAAGVQGMAGGQAMDIAATAKTVDLAQLEMLHGLKTGALIMAAVSMGATVAGASAEQLTQLENYAKAIGLAFQIQDDILDIESDTATLGKQQGSDKALQKSTYPPLLGITTARAKAQTLYQQALTALSSFGEAAEDLRGLSTTIITRTH